MLYVCFTIVFITFMNTQVQTEDVQTTTENDISLFRQDKCSIPCFWDNECSGLCAIKHVGKLDQCHYYCVRFTRRCFRYIPEKQLQKLNIKKLDCDINCRKGRDADCDFLCNFYNGTRIRPRHCRGHQCQREPQYGDYKCVVTWLKAPQFTIPLTHVLLLYLFVTILV